MRFSFPCQLITKPVLVAFYICSIASCSSFAETEEKNKEPDAEYFAMRNQMYGAITPDIKAAIKNRISIDKLQRSEPAETLTELSWQNIGPSNTGGRITDIEMPLGNDNIIYAGNASGGIFKSVDFGINWLPIFDDAPALAIGDLEIDPNNDNIIYAGTGEPNTGGGSITYDGDGVYKSVNAGASWNSIGLTDVGTIGKVAVAKTNSSIIYVAAVGNIYQKSVNKGLYKSADGGTNWNKILYISDSTSVNDVAVSPVDANTVYATAWERISRPGVRVYGGITTNLYKSIDGGTNWTKLLPDDANRGKMTIDIPPTNAGKLFVSIANKNGTFNTLYRYDGTSFTPINNGISASSTYVWWFSGIECHPTDENIVYFSDFNLFRTSNGGANWSGVAPASHVDHHSVFVHPANIAKVVLGNDGGVYTSQNALSNITLCKIPNAQVYDFDVYKANETYISAGFQDNSFAGTTSQVADNWQPFGGGDGVQIRINPVTRTETYSSQYGGLNITSNGISSFDRKNWKCPIRLDPVDPGIRYFGTNKVYKFNPPANRWTAISGDLTNGTGSGSGVFGNITTLAVASTNSNYIYSGSDDGQVYVTKDGGANWTKITTGLPVLWTTFIKADRTNPEIAYVGFSGYRYGVTDAHIYKTVNAGASWTRVSNDLPQLPVNDLEIDPADSSLLYLATDIGVYYSNNGGTNWLRLGSNMPNVVVSTLNFAVNTKQLYAATYGRSIYKLNLHDVVLPHNFISLSVTEKPGNKAMLQWTSDIGFNQGSFEVEESSNAAAFKKLTALAQVNAPSNIYTHTVDLGNRSENNFYYRIQYTDKNGLTIYSPVVMYTVSNSNFAMKVYPNPANGFINVAVTGSGGSGIIAVYNSVGRKLMEEKTTAGTTVQKINIQSFSAGIYTVVYTAGNKKISTQIIVKR